MYCSNCGKEIADDAKFCAQCGASVSGEKDSNWRKPVDDQVDTVNPVLVVRPVFIGWVTALSVLPLQIFFTIWGAGFCGGFSLMAVKALKLPLPTWFTFVFFGCLFFFGIPLVTYFGKKRTYIATEYKFYSDRLEYAEGFWTAEKKTVKYDKITETALRRGVIQKKYDLGTLYLATPATGFGQGRAMSGIRIMDIENPEQVYEKVQEMIGK